MDRFEDFTFSNEADAWLVSAFDVEKEDRVILRVAFWELVAMAKEHYGMNKSEATIHIGICETEEEDKLLKLLFIERMT